MPTTITEDQLNPALDTIVSVFSCECNSGPLTEKRPSQEAKMQRKALAERKLDFARAGEVVNKLTLTQQDMRADYREPRFTTAGWTVV